MKGRAKGILLTLLLLMAMALPVQAASAKLSEKSAVLIKGQTLTLKVTGSSGTVEWSTNNKDVATVSSNGRVSAKKKGNATITAKVDDRKLTCKITVEEPHLNYTSKSVKVGDTVTMKLYGTSQKVTWTSSAKTVATITQTGKVTAKKKGTTTITATVLSKKYTCKITVKETGSSSSGGSSSGSSSSGSSSSKKLSLNRKTLSLTVGDSETLTARRTGTTAKVTWTSSDKKVATVSSKGKITAKGAGKAVITAKAGSLTATCTVTVTEPQLMDYLNQLMELLGK